MEQGKRKTFDPKDTLSLPFGEPAVACAKTAGIQSLCISPKVGTAVLLQNDSGTSFGRILESNILCWLLLYGFLSKEMGFC